MREANINDRPSIERLYPIEDFAHDAGENSDAKATVHRGLRILSPVDREGRFRAERASRHVAESDPEGDTIFLAPFFTDADPAQSQGDTYGGPTPTADAQAASTKKTQDYRSFLDRIIEAAKTAHFKRAIGRDEDRLRGFHGG